LIKFWRTTLEYAAAAITAGLWENNWISFTLTLQHNFCWGSNKRAERFHLKWSNTSFLWPSWSGQSFHQIFAPVSIETNMKFWVANHKRTLCKWESLTTNHVQKWNF